MLFHYRAISFNCQSIFSNFLIFYSLSVLFCLLTFLSFFSLLTFSLFSFRDSFPYTMVEMAKAHGLNVESYLTFLLKNRPHQGMSDEEFENLAPWSKAAREFCGVGVAE